MPTDLAAAADELAPLAPAWQAVHAQSGSAPVFLTWGWQHAWWAHFGRGRPLRAVALADGGQPLALAPFFDDGGAWRLIGAPQDAIDLADYLDVLVPADREEAGWRALAAWLAGRDDWSAVVLDNVPAGSPTLQAGRAALAGAGLRVAVEEAARCPALPLPGDFDAYLARLDREARHELRRKLRRFEREAPGGRLALLRGEAAVAALPEFVRLHRLSGADKARFMTPTMERFFADMAAALAREDLLLLAFLERPGVGAIAALCLFDYRGAWYLYNSGYDPAWARLAPGLVLLARCIEAAVAAGIRTFDFLRGTERYKYDLGGLDRPVFRLTITRG